MFAQLITAVRMRRVNKRAEFMTYASSDDLVTKAEEEKKRSG